MRSSDLDILIVPGLGDSGPDHWQSRWQAKLSTARRVVQDDFSRAGRRTWEKRLIEEAAKGTRPIMLVGHSLGVIAVAHAATALKELGAIGAFLVAPPSAAAILSIPEIDKSFAPFPPGPLPFPSVLVASGDDPWCPLGEAEDLAFSWGSAFTPAGDAGHINSDSGHGPWPEGSLRFASFLKTLKA